MVTVDVIRVCFGVKTVAVGVSNTVDLTVFGVDIYYMHERLVYLHQSWCRLLQLGAKRPPLVQNGHPWCETAIIGVNTITTLMASYAFTGACCTMYL
jgi:hypothetical protein